MWREWASKAGAYWMGWRPSVEKDRRVQSLALYAAAAGLDAAEVKRLLRPRLIFMRNDYHPKHFLLAGRLKESLDRGVPLPSVLHHLMTHPDAAARRVFLAASDAYIEKVCPSFSHDEGPVERKMVSMRNLIAKTKADTRRLAEKYVEQYRRTQEKVRRRDLKRRAAGRAENSAQRSRRDKRWRPNR